MRFLLRNFSSGRIFLVEKPPPPLFAIGAENLHDGAERYSGLRRPIVVDRLVY